MWYLIVSIPDLCNLTYFARNYIFSGRLMKQFEKQKEEFNGIFHASAELKNSTCPLVLTSVSGCTASENLDISTENYPPPPAIYANTLGDAVQVPILRYFEVCSVRTKMLSSDKVMPHDQTHWLKTLIFTPLQFIKAVARDQ